MSKSVYECIEAEIVHQKNVIRKNNFNHSDILDSIRYFMQNDVTTMETTWACNVKPSARVLDGLKKIAGLCIILGEKYGFEMREFSEVLDEKE